MNFESASPEELLVQADGHEVVKIGGYVLPAEDFSLTSFMLKDLGMTWLHPGGLPSTERMFRILAPTRDSRLLDLGCGVGSTTRYAVTKYGCEAVGIDRDAEMIGAARRRSRAKRYARLSFEVMNGNTMSFPDSSFDCVVLQSVACFNDKLPLLRETLRVLKPGGRVALNEVTWMRPPSEKVAKVTRATICETFRGAMLESDWLELLSQAGFDLVSRETLEFEPVAPYQLLREEGLVNTLRTFTRVLTNPSNLMRLSAVSDYFKRFPGFFGYGIYIGAKPATGRG